MGIILSNGVTNLKNTPSAITDVIANRPVATSVSEGCIFISTDTAEMYSNVSGSWVLIGGGGGGGTSTGVNGLNGTTSIGLGGLLIVDTSINGDGISYGISFDQMKYFYGQSDDISLSLSSNGNVYINMSSLFIALQYNASGIYFENNITNIGDWNSQINSTKLSINDSLQLIKTQFGNGSAFDIGFYADNEKTILGDYQQTTSDKLAFVVDYSLTQIYTKLNFGTNNEYGFQIVNNGGDPYCVLGDYANNGNTYRFYVTNGGDVSSAVDLKTKGIIVQFTFDKYSLGDYNGHTNGASYVVDNYQYIQYTGWQDNSQLQPKIFGFYVINDYGINRRAYLGDGAGNYNGTRITVDDAQQRINMDGAIMSSGAGGSSGQHLQLWINGTLYKIALLNP